MVEQALTWLQEMIAIPSINPMAGEATPPFGEKAMGDYLFHLFARLGLDVVRQPVLPGGRDNILGFAQGRDSSRTLLLESHMDTVQVENMTIAPFEPKVEEGRIYGRGACDAKGQIAAMLGGVAAALRRGKPAVNLYLLAAVDEEFQYRGITQWVEEGYRADMAVVGEPTELDVVIAHKGALRWRLETRGQAAHSSEPQQGRNAIYDMARVVLKLEAYARELASRPPHPLCGPPTLSVTLISGGQQVNVVPDRCQLWVDRRLLPQEDPKGAQEEFLRRLEAVGDFEVEALLALSSPGMEVSPQEPIVRRMEALVQMVRGAAALKGVPYGSDAGKLVASGIPAVVFGPGSIRQAHTAEEFLEVAQLEEAIAVYQRLLTEEWP